MVWRVRAYSSASSRQRWIRPTAERPDHRARAVEHLHRDQKAVALSVNQRARRDFDVVQEHLRRRPGSLTQLAQRLADRHAGRVPVHEESADAPVSGLRIGLGEDHEHLRERRVRDPDLAAVENVAIAFLHGTGLDASDVGARSRLGERVGTELPRLQAAERLALELRRAGHMEHVGEDRVEPERARDPSTGPAQFLGDQRRLQRTPTAAAERYRHRHVHQTDLARLLEHAHRKARLPVALRGHRLNLLARELAGRPPDQLLLIVELEVHELLAAPRRFPATSSRDTARAAWS